MSKPFVHFSMDFVSNTTLYQFRWTENTEWYVTNSEEEAMKAASEGAQVFRSSLLWHEVEPQFVMKV